MTATTIQGATNSGTISGSGYDGLGIYADTIGTITNSHGGSISGAGAVLASSSDYGAGFGILANSNIQSVSNQATISGSGYRGFGVRSGISIGALDNINTGDISGVGSSSGYGLGVGVLASTGPLSSLTNRGKISGSGYYGIGAEASIIGSLTNFGSITGTELDRVLASIPVAMRT